MDGIDGIDGIGDWCAEDYGDRTNFQVSPPLFGCQQGLKVQDDKLLYPSMEHYSWHALATSPINGCMMVRENAHLPVRRRLCSQ